MVRVVLVEAVALGGADGALYSELALVCWCAREPMYSLNGSGRFGRTPRVYFWGALTKVVAQ